MKIRTNIQGSTIDIYPSGYDLTQAGKRLDFSNPNSLPGGYQNNLQFVEQLLHYNPGITHQLSSSAVFNQQVIEIQQQFEMGELIAIQPDSEPEDSQRYPGHRLEANSISVDSVSTIARKSPQNQRAYSPTHKTAPSERPTIEPEALDYQLTIEVAGRNLPHDQFIMLNKVAHEPSTTRFAENDHKQQHRSQVNFQHISQAPRKISLAISMNSQPSPMLLPLTADNLTPTKNSRSKPEWDNVIIPIKPLRRYSTTDKPNKTTELRNGWLYLFWKGKLWRELEVSTNSVMRDCRVEWYRNQISFGQHNHETPRKAEGHWLHNIWVPYKIDNEYQLGRNGLRIAFSETQWSWNLIESLESGIESFIAKTSSLDAIKQYSTQQHFGSADDSIDALEIAIDTSKNRQANLKSKPSKIAAVYLAPEPNRICLKINDHQLKAMTGKRYQIIAGNNKLEGTLSADGMINESLPYPATEGELMVWCSDSESPSHRIPLKLEQLADIKTTAGIQARLNNLNHNAGNVDGITGPKTLAAIKQFQQQHKLTVDGDAGPITQKTLKDVHGN